jgi:NADPH-dependent 2,4-dienoyl-CoA reductase/sulfur reductase-like enzyme/rhodanese-related sulfurtransferase
MSAAARLRRLDETAHIIVFERGQFVSFANCGLPYFVGGEIEAENDLLLQTPASLRASLNLDVRVGHDVIGVDPARRLVRVRRHDVFGNTVDATARTSDLAQITPDSARQTADPTPLISDSPRQPTAASRLPSDSTRSTSDSAPQTSDLIEEVAYDALILAPGAQPSRPPIPGLDHPAVHTLRTISDAVALRDAVATGAGQVVVLGAGFIGLEAAESLVARGLDVSVVEYAPHVLPPLEKELAWLVAEELRRLGVSLYEGTAAQVITPGTLAATAPAAGAPAAAEFTPGEPPVPDATVPAVGSDVASPIGPVNPPASPATLGPVVVRLSDGRALPADLVVSALGVTPDTAVFEAAGVDCSRGYIIVDEHGRSNLPHVYAVGDATLARDAITGASHPVPLAGPANRAGRYVADAVVFDQANGQRNPPRPLPPLLSTAIVRVGRLTAALTGANRASLAAAGMEFATIHVHPMSHAGYYPGAKQMHLVVHIDPASGRVLGAQGLGEDGVDKRIDVLATAIRAGLTAPDLIDLDLAYSPPYGSAKDPVTMVGFVADNLMTGQTRLWYLEQLVWARSPETLLLDVRTPQEFATGHLPEAHNVPHTQLRERIDEVRQLAAGREVAVMCQSGVRSYIAHRVLVAAGLESATLSGGMLTLRAWLGEDADNVLVR